MKILLVSFSNIGDAVLSLPVLHSLASAYPDAAIDIVAGPRAQIVFEHESAAKRIRVYDKKRPWREKFSFFASIYRERYDLVVDLRRSVFGFLGKRANSPFGRPRSRHRRLAHLETLAELGVEAANEAGRMGIPGEAEGRIDDALCFFGPKRGPLVVIAPGARSHTKQWRPERFAGLAERLAELDSARVVWIGDESERELVEKIRASLAAPTLSLAGRTSWVQTLALLSRADLVVTNDSAPLHAADQLGRRVLAIFGPTDPLKYGPTHSGAVLFRSKFCSPCEKAQCRFHLECLQEITLDEAYKKALMLLEDGDERASPRVLVVRLDRIGDLLLTLPVFGAVRSRFPAARITALVRPHGKTIAERSRDVDDSIVYDYSKGGRHASLKGFWRLIREVRRRRYDVAFVVHPTLRSHLVCFLAGIPVRIGYRTRGAFLLTQSVPDRRREGLQHESRNALDVLRLFGIEGAPGGGEFRVFPEDTRAVEALFKARGLDSASPYCVLHAGASSVSKRWPEEKFICLARLLLRELKTPIVLVGDERHAELNRRIAASVGDGSVDFTGETPLAVLAALLKRGTLFVSNDSGPVHLAAAVGAPVISIFGRKEPGLGPRRWKPLGERSVFIQKDPGCVVCLADDCPIEFECLKMLSPEEVLAMSLRLLHRREKSAAAAPGFVR